MPRQLKIAPERCIGCKSCELGCSLANEGVMNPSRSRITMICFLEGKYPLPYNVPLTCKQCSDAPCLAICPVGAISRLKGELKTVAVDQERCIGCGKCVIACPFGAMLFNREGKKAFKCELCGGQPACASICPTGAIVFARMRPFYSKEMTLQMEGFSILSKRNREGVRRPKIEK